MPMEKHWIKGSWSVQFVASKVHPQLLAWCHLHQDKHWATCLVWNPPNQPKCLSGYYTSGLKPFTKRWLLCSHNSVSNAIEPSPWDNWIDPFTKMDPNTWSSLLDIRRIAVQAQTAIGEGQEITINYVPFIQVTSFAAITFMQLTSDRFPPLTSN